MYLWECIDLKFKIWEEKQDFICDAMFEAPINIKSFLLKTSSGKEYLIKSGHIPKISDKKIRYYAWLKYNEIFGGYTRENAINNLIRIMNLELKND